MSALPELVSFLEAAPDPHIVFDTQYRIVAANAAYCSRFGEGRSVIGRTCYEVSHHATVPCDQAGESCPLARARTSNRRENVLHLHHTPRGEEYINIELAPVLDASGRQAYFVERMEALSTAQSNAPGQGLVGRAPAFVRAMELVARVARSEAAVLLLGESGSGKELVARAVHDASRRADRPLVVVECSGLTETLFESELFGHERGAFTGAATQKRGLVESASGGTLFLDEVGDIPLGMQVKLLRLLEAGTYRRVGSTEPRRADVRIVSATHRDLPQMIADGKFRQDLYYRLSTFPIRLPSLRERREDISLLAETLLQRLTLQRKLRWHPDALSLLQSYDYPGNIRELRNLIERATLICDGNQMLASHIREAVDLGCRPAGPTPSGELDGPSPDQSSRSSARGVSLKDIEADALATLLAQHRGTRAELAQHLGISPRTLYRKMQGLRLK